MCAVVCWGGVLWRRESACQQSMMSPVHVDTVTQWLQTTRVLSYSWAVNLECEWDAYGMVDVHAHMKIVQCMGRSLNGSVCRLILLRAVITCFLAIIINLNITGSQICTRFQCIAIHSLKLSMCVFIYWHTFAVWIWNRNAGHSHTYSSQTLLPRVCSRRVWERDRLAS